MPRYLDSIGTGLKLMAEEESPVNVESMLAAAGHALMQKDRIEEAEVLASAKASAYVSGYDNWNGGTTSWELKLEIPFPKYFELEEVQRKSLESFIDEVISPYLSDSGHWMTSKIRPADFSDDNWRSPVAVRALPRDKYQAIEEPQAPHAFISYQTADKQVAGKLQRILEEVGIPSFLAHEDIEVSATWRERILEELGKARFFISLLSENYFQSPWCVQESGIAAYRGITSLHLSLDGCIPRGFSSNIQSVKINPDDLSLPVLLPGITLTDFDLGIDIITSIIGSSASFRGAEANFRLILPYVKNMSDDQMKKLLVHACENGQIHHASQCAREYIPPLLSSHGHLLDDESRRFLSGICEQYL